MPGQALDMTMKTGTGEVIPGHNHILTDIAVQVTMTHMEAAPGYDTKIVAITPGVAHDAQVPHTGVTAIDPTATHHMNPTADHMHTDIPHPTTPEINIDHIHIHSTNHQDRFA